MKVTGDVMPMLKAFTFEEGGRTYECTPEKRGDPSRGSWWWFTVSNDSQRYARFEAAVGDTRSSVRTRIVAYYEHRVWVRAQPVVLRKHFGRPAKPPAPPPAP
ncbi:MAG: hypothetical protein MUO50_14845 [Longimicrobiales bacterium]|nr:hypothetical protein [Longimicrobiales bacterium]